MEYILVVEDDASILRLIQVNLKTAGYQVQLAKDGEDAWEKITKEVPSLIITNIMMPKLDGYSLLNRIKITPSLNQMPRIVISARTEKEDIDMAMRSGADCYVTKPFTPKLLLQQVKELLNPVTIPS